MALEDLTGPNKFISSLVPANPPQTDPASQGSDHIQGIKNVLQNSFPGMAGAYQIASAQGLNANSMTRKDYVDLKAIPITLGNDSDMAIKFDSGLMILMLNNQRTDIAIDQAYGSLYLGSLEWAFLVPFVAPPVVLCSMFSAVGQAGWGFSTKSSTPLSSGSLKGLDVASRAVGTAINISAVAIGRWK